jgi:predicted nucleic acid-binding protein
VVSGDTRFVAADASPLIGLAAAGAFHVLRELFGTVMITRLVKDEVARGADLPGARELDEALRAGWIRVAPTPLQTWRFAELDAGEASTLALASNHEGALVLMDDARGRTQAVALGLAVLDVADVLLAAKRAGHVAAVRPLVARLTKRGFTLRDDTRLALLRAAGEHDPVTQGGEP